MITITLTVSKARVYNEVAKTTSYTGSKMTGDEGAYSRIFTTDDDRLMLERFWVESCNAVTQNLKPFVTSVSSHPVGDSVDLARNYTVSMSLPSTFDANLVDSIESSLFSFFVSLIVSKWFKFTNREESESYALESAGLMEDVLRKVYHRKSPIREVPN